MKITSIDVFQLKPACKDFGYMFNPVICRVNTDEGIYGYGECGISVGFGAQATVGMLQDIASYYIGKDPFDNDVIWQNLTTIMYGHVSGGGAIVWSALSGLDIALMDIKGKALGLPCCKLMGGVFSDKLESYASHLENGWGRMLKALGPTKEYAEVAQIMVEEGYTATKVDVTQYDINGKLNPRRQTSDILFKYDMLRLAEERLAAIREAAGPGFSISYEAVCRTGMMTSVDLDRIGQKYNVDYMEDAVDPFRAKNYAVLNSRTKTALAAGEKVWTRWGFQNYFDDYSLSVIQPNIGCCGGMSEAKKICDMALVYDIKVAMHGGSSPIGTAATLQLEATLPNFYMHEVLATASHPDMVDYCIYDYRPVNGIIEVPMIPGIGNELSDKAIAEAEVHIVLK